MFRKSIITALTVAIVATSAISLSTTDASARNGRNGAAVAGALLGFAAGAAIVSHRRNKYRHNHGHYGRYHGRRAVCYDKPIRRWNRYDELVVVGYRTVCR